MSTFAPPERKAGEKAHSPASSVKKPARGLRVSSSTFGPQLTLGKATDPQEREADGAADRIVAGLDAPAFSTSDPSHGLVRISPALTGRILAARSHAAHALEPGLRSTLEARTETDLSEVRVHTGARASELAQSIQARAFTLHQDVFFNSGEYRPHTGEGRHLIAHEVAHVVQSASSRGPGVIRRSLQFDASITDASIGLIEPGSTRRRSAGLLTEFKQGLGKYLGVNAEFVESEDAGRQTILVNDAKIDKSKEKEVWDRFYEGLYLKLGEYVSVKHAHSAALERMQKYATVNVYHGWRRVRDLVVEAINSGTILNILDDPKAPGGAVHSPFDGQIHINENLYEKYIARADVNWDGFWIILHEFLHSQGYQDAVNSGSKEVPLQEWQTIPIGDANGEAIQEVRMLWTMPGAVEAELNLIRMIFGLPLRYGYADNSFLRFSKLSARRSEDFTYDVTGEGKGPAYYEYYGAAIDPSLSNKLMTEQEGRQGNKDRAQTAENLALRAFMVSRTFTGELGGRKASVRFEGGGDNAAVMVVEYMGRAGRGKATEGVRLVCTFQYNADRRERIVMIVGPWDGWPIMQFKQQGKEDRFVGSFGGKPSWFAARAAANDPRAAPPRRR